MIQAIRKKPKTKPLTPAAAMSGAGMAEDGRGEHDGHHEAAEGRDPHALAQHQQHEEEGQDGQRRDEGREGPAAERVVVLVPGQGELLCRDTAGPRARRDIIRRPGTVKRPAARPHH